MPTFSVSGIPLSNDLDFQEYMLQHVSRTFALTIPQLPQPLAAVVGNAYLLCRIADTIEDDLGLPLEKKQYYSQCLLSAMANPVEAKALEREVGQSLRSATPAEQGLMVNLSRVLALYRSFNANQRAILLDCVRIMTSGMSFYQRRATRLGCEDIDALNSYCYHVAGVVGEMLTGLFCEYSPEIRHRQQALNSLSASFGQGLQMTNILKDFTVDLERGVCWLPKQVFIKNSKDKNPVLDRDYVIRLVSITHGHLRDALEYTLLIPKHERGIRQFCLWGIGMALLTLRKVYRAGVPDIAGQSAKISRTAVKLTIAGAQLSANSNTLLRSEFKLLSRGLPPIVLNPLNTETFRSAVQ